MLGAVVQGRRLSASAFDSLSANDLPKPQPSWNAVYGTKAARKIIRRP